jgi:catalase
MQVSLPLILASFILASCSDSAKQVEDIDKLVAEMAQRVVATTDMEKRGELIPRYNQPKTIACLNGEFAVADGLPEEYRHGLFEIPATYPVTARFANASKWDDSEKDIRGLSLRVTEVPGNTLWGEPGAQDFLFNSYPALFVATPEEFLGFMRARQEGSKLSLARFFLSPFDPHIKSLITVIKARGKHKSPLDIRYWSTVPSALDSRLAKGDAPTADTQAVKYSVTPCSSYQTDKVVEPGENQLRAAIKAHLRKERACFNFGIQIQGDPDKMPVEDASVIWDEDSSPFVTVATLTFADQSVDDPQSLADCEQRQFNPWQSLPQHTPLGRMNAVRKEVYATGAYQRTNRKSP